MSCRIGLLRGSARARRDFMNFEKYTDRARGFVQSAQSLATREGQSAVHPRTFAQGPARRRPGSGRRSDRSRGRALARRACADRAGLVQTAQSAGPRRRARFICRPRLARIFDSAEQIAQKAGDSYVTVERLLLALAMEKKRRSGQDSRQSRRHAAERSMAPSRSCARAAPPTMRRRKTPMTR